MFIGCGQAIHVERCYILTVTAFQVDSKYRSKGTRLGDVLPPRDGHLASERLFISGYITREPQRQGDSYPFTFIDLKCFFGGNLNGPSTKVIESNEIGEKAL